MCRIFLKVVALIPEARSWDTSVWGLLRWQNAICRRRHPETNTTAQTQRSGAQLCNRHTRLCAIAKWENWTKTRRMSIYSRQRLAQGRRGSVTVGRLFEGLRIEQWRRFMAMEEYRQVERTFFIVENRGSNAPA